LTSSTRAAEMRVPLLEEGGEEAAGRPTLRPYDIRQAALRVMTLFDLLVSDPQEALRCFASDAPQEHPLRNLFEPSPAQTIAEARPSQGGAVLSADQRTDVETHTLVAGDKVYAERAESQDKAEFRHDKYPHAPPREWHLATINRINGETCSIAWHDEFPEQTKNTSELVFAGPRDWETGEDHLMRRRGCYAKPLRSKKLFITGLTVTAFLSLQPYTTFFLKAPQECRIGDGTAEALHCKAFQGLQYGGAVILGLVSWASAWALFNLAAPLVFKLLRSWNFQKAMLLRQLIAGVMDPILVKDLPGLAGMCEQQVLVAYFGMVLAFACLAGITRDTGALALGTVLATRFLSTSNTLLGEARSISQLRTSQLLARLEVLRMKTGADISAEDLRAEAIAFLAHDVHSDAMRLSLPLFLLLAAGTCLPDDKLDSLRVRYLMVPKAYILDHKERSFQVPSELDNRRDIVIDLFQEHVADAVEIAGMEYVDRGKERYFLQGCKLMWHLGVQPHLLSRYENELRALGLVHGEGMFTWVPSGGMQWAAWEAKGTAAAEAEAQRARDRLSTMGEALSTLARAGDAGGCLALLENGAPVNHLSEGSETPLNFACWFGQEHIAQLLVERRADLDVVDSRGMTALIWACAQKMEQAAQLLVERRADVNVVNSSGNTALYLASHSGLKQAVQAIKSAQAAK